MPSAISPLFPGPKATYGALGKRYTDVQTIGNGSSGDVVAAIERSSGEIAAVKVVPKSSLVNSSLKLAICREVKILQTVQHPNIVESRGAFEDKYNVYIATEYCSDGDLLSYLQHRERLAEEHALSLFVQVLSALDYLHSRDICHRDIKLENVVMQGGIAKLIDFGMSHWRRSGGKRTTNLVGGTSMYMAPEMFGNTAYVPEQAECWSCGVLLYALLTRTMPFPECSRRRLEFIIQKANTATLLRSPLLRHVSPGTRYLLGSLLNVTPSKRPTPAEALAHLNRYAVFANTSPISSPQGDNAHQKEPWLDGHEDRKRFVNNVESKGIEKTVIHKSQPERLEQLNTKKANLVDELKQKQSHFLDELKKKQCQTLSTTAFDMEKKMSESAKIAKPQYMDKPVQDLASGKKAQQEERKPSWYGELFASSQVSGCPDHKPKKVEMRSVVVPGLSQPPFWAILSKLMQDQSSCSPPPLERRLQGAKLRRQMLLTTIAKQQWRRQKRGVVTYISAKDIRGCLTNKPPRQQSTRKAQKMHSETPSQPLIGKAVTAKTGASGPSGDRGTVAMMRDVRRDVDAHPRFDPLAGTEERKQGMLDWTTKFFQPLIGFFQKAF